MKNIDSETKFLLKFIWHILLTPITLILVILKKKEPKSLFQPFHDLLKFLLEPKFTISIIIINIICFFASLIFFNEQFFLSLINYPNDLLNFRFHTLITSGFLHADLSHLLWNMLGIFIFGRVVEKKLGSYKTGFIYFGSLLLSGLFSSLIYLFLVGKNIGGLGASGALMGLIATAILLDPFYITYESIIPLPIMILGWFAIYADIIGILNPTADGIGHLAHIGGFISITLLMFFLGIEQRSKLKKGLIINIISLITGIILYFIILR
jgi:membrane associated rhomboid family serine protease